MLGLDEVAEITGHEVGGVCPFGLKTPLPVYCDVSLKAFDIVVPAAGSTHSAVQDHAGADGGTDCGRMGRRLRAQAAPGSAGLFVFLVIRSRLGLHRLRLHLLRRAGTWRHLLRTTLRRPAIGLLLLGVRCRTPRGNHWRAAACSAASTPRSGRHPEPDRCTAARRRACRPSAVPRFRDIPAMMRSDARPLPPIAMARLRTIRCVGMSGSFLSISR